MSPLPRTLLISRNFPPLVGGMERVNFHLLRELSVKFETLFIGPRGAEISAPTAKKVLTCPAMPIQHFLACATPKAILLALQARPKLIIAGSGVSAPSAWLAAKACNAQWGIYLHGLDLVVKNYAYQKIFLPIIRKADFWFANSRATAEIGAQMGLDSKRIHLLHPGVDIPFAMPSKEEIIEWRKGIGAAESPIIISVGRLTKRKGILEFIRYSMPSIVKAEPNTLLVIIGSEPKQSLISAGTAQAAIKEAARDVDLENNVRLLGQVEDKQLSIAYCAAKAHVFPVLNLPGDMEGFGIVAVEAAAHGLPSVAFAVGGVSDAVSDGRSGYLVQSGNYTDFANKVITILQGDIVGAERLCREFAEQFSWDAFGAALRRCHPIRSLIK